MPFSSMINIQAYLLLLYLKYIFKKLTNIKPHKINIKTYPIFNYIISHSSTRKDVTITAGNNIIFVNNKIIDNFSVT